MYVIHFFGENHDKKIEMDKKIEFSLDRLGAIWTLPDMPLDFNMEDFFIPVTEIFTKYAGQVKLDFKTFGNSLSIQVLGSYESESLIYFNKPDYTKVIRFDMNPKRFREMKWAADALKEIIEKMRVGSLDFQYADWLKADCDTSQVDLAIDMINWSPDSKVLRLVKLGSTETQIIDDRSGDIGTRYYGARSSSSYARWYNKSSEQRVQIVNKYRSKKVKMMNDLDRLNEHSDVKTPNIINGFDLTDEEERNKFLSHFVGLDNLNILGVDLDDVDNIQAVKNIVEIGLNAEKMLELDEVPSDWKRLEIVLRVKKLKKERNFSGRNNYEFDPQSIQEYLDKLTIETTFQTVSDPVIRSLISSINSGLIDKKDLSKTLIARINAVKKWDNVAVYYPVGSSRLHYKSADDLNPGEQVKEYITRQKDTELIDLIKSGFEENKDRLLDELNGYFI